MKNYDIQLIYDYITGKEIIGYDIDELENDMDFMIRVINATNDKKIYNLCSYKLKTNFEFVKYLVNKFHDDANFILEVAKKALNKWSLEDRLSIIELRILLTKCLPDGMDRLVVDSRWLLESYYVKKSISYTEFIETIEDDRKRKLHGMGFVFAIDEFGDRELLKDFFAGRMLMDIFNVNSGFNLEKLVHDNFDKGKDLINYGINNFLIKYISENDPFLGDYVSAHVDLIANYKHKIMKYLDDYHWYQYEQKNEKSKIMAIIDEILVFYKEYYDGIDIYEELLEYIANEFGLTKLFMKYDAYFRYYIENKDNEFEFYNIAKLEVDKLPFYSYCKLMELKKVIVKIWNSDLNFDSYYQPFKTKKHDCKILKINFNNTKYRHK